MMAIENTSPIPLLVKWTPRAFCVIVGGYYGLGISYEYGLMAKVDKIGIRALKYFAGSVGIGLMMPTFQWYSAWAVRISIGLAAGLAYDLTERVIQVIYTCVTAKKQPTPQG